MQVLNLHTGRSLTQNTIPDAVLIQFDILMMSTVLLETCRGLLYKVIVHQVGHLPRVVPGCTVRKHKKKKVILVLYKLYRLTGKIKGNHTPRYAVSYLL